VFSFFFFFFLSIPSTGSPHLQYDTIRHFSDIDAGGFLVTTTGIHKLLKFMATVL